MGLRPVLLVLSVEVRFLHLSSPSNVLVTVTVGFGFGSQVDQPRPNFRHRYVHAQIRLAERRRLVVRLERL